MKTNNTFLENRLIYQLSQTPQISEDLSEDPEVSIDSLESELLGLSDQLSDIEQLTMNEIDEAKTKIQTLLKNSESLLVGIERSRDIPIGRQGELIQNITELRENVKYLWNTVHDMLNPIEEKVETLNKEEFLKIMKNMLTNLDFNGLGAPDIQAKFEFAKQMYRTSKALDLEISEQTAKKILKLVVDNYVTTGRNIDYTFSEGASESQKTTNKLILDDLKNKLRESNIPRLA